MNKYLIFVTIKYCTIIIRNLIIRNIYLCYIPILILIALQAKSTVHIKSMYSIDFTINLRFPYECILQNSPFSIYFIV